jgi:EAL and modified HD-GYP domain-containing signal transduction protein
MHDFMEQPCQDLATPCDKEITMSVFWSDTMAFANLIKQLFGDRKQESFPETPFGPKDSTPQEEQAAEAELANTPVEIPVLVHRDEILDGRSRIAGYRFTVRYCDHDTAPSVAAVVAALQDENLVDFAQRRLALIPISGREWWTSKLRQLITPNTTFLIEVPADQGGAGDLANVLADIREAGGKAALRSAVFASGDKLAPLTDLVLIDFRAYSVENLESFVTKLASEHAGIAIAVDGIQSWPEHRMCQAMGAKYSLGGFAAQPEHLEQGEKLNQSRLVLIEMLNLLRREADVGELAEVAKRDPAIAMKIVGMANSPGAGLASAVASLEQAIMALGRDTIYRWLSLSMFRAGSNSGRDEALLELALCRARFLELVATGSRPKKECDELFLVGLLSLLDSLLGMPIAKVLEKLNLPQRVADVLLKSEGPYGRYLMLALAMEKNRSEQADRLARELGIEFEALEKSSAASLAWAEQAMQAS